MFIAFSMLRERNKQVKKLCLTIFCLASNRNHTLDKQSGLVIDKSCGVKSYNGHHLETAHGYSR